MPDAPDDRAFGAQDRPVEAVVGPVAQRAVRFIGQPAAPVIGAVTSGEVDQGGDRLAIARGETIGDERRLGEQLRRNPDAERAGGRVELVLDTEAIQDERLLTEPPAAIALADRSGGEGDGLLDAGDGQASQFSPREALLILHGEGIEHRVHRLGDHLDRLEPHRVRLQGEVELGRLAGAHQHAVPALRPATDGRRRKAVPSRGKFPNPVQASRIGGHDEAAAIDSDPGPGQRLPFRLRSAYGTRHRSGRLGQERDTPADHQATEQQDRGSLHGTSNR